MAEREYSRSDIYKNRCLNVGWAMASVAAMMIKAEFAHDDEPHAAATTEHTVVYGLPPLLRESCLEEVKPGFDIELSHDQVRDYIEGDGRRRINEELLHEAYQYFSPANDELLVRVSLAANHEPPDKTTEKAATIRNLAMFAFTTPSPASFDLKSLSFVLSSRQPPGLIKVDSVETIPDCKPVQPASPTN